MEKDPIQLFGYHPLELVGKAIDLPISGTVYVGCLTFVIITEAIRPLVKGTHSIYKHLSENNPPLRLRLRGANSSYKRENSNLSDRF